MDENTIFQGKNQEGQNLPLPQASQVNPQIEKKVASPFPIPPPADDQEYGGFPFGTIIKAVVGLIVLVAIIFGIINFILPQFSKNKNEKATLNYWGLWEDPAAMNGIITDFEKQNPNIKVVYTKQDIKQYRDRIVARAGNGTGPDVFEFHNTWLSEMNGYLLPLPSDVVSKDDFQKTYFPIVSSDLIKNGAIYGIPGGMDTLSLFVNPEIFSQVGVAIPQTWQDFSSAARQLTVQDENGKIKTSGAAIGTFSNITHASDIISLLLIQNGADLNNLSSTSQSVIDTLNYYTNFVKGDGRVWDDSLDPSVLAFAKGNVAMYFGYSWDIFTIKAINPDLTFKVASVPHLPGRNMTIASYWANGVSAKSSHQSEAMLFLKFLSQKETVQKLYTEESKTRLFGEPYARVDMADSLKDNDIVYPFVNQAKIANSSFFASDTYDNGLNTQMNSYLANAVNAVLGNISTETAVNNLIKGVNQVLSQYK